MQIANTKIVVHNTEIGELGDFRYDFSFRIVHQPNGKQNIDMPWKKGSYKSYQQGQRQGYPEWCR